MLRSSATGLPVIAGIIALSVARPARAEPALPCSEVAVEGDASIQSRWPDLVRALRAAFLAREDVDLCARVTLTARDSTILVAVFLPDGRSAARSIARREDVAPAVEALLLLPERSPRPSASGPEVSAATAPPDPEPTSSSAPSTTAPHVRAPAESPVSERDAPPSVTRASAGLRIELSAEAGARIGDGQTSIGLGALSFLEFSGWLVGFQGRLDRYRRLTPSDNGLGPPDGPSEALELSVLGGRRVRLDSFAFDFLVGAAGALAGTTNVQTATPGGTMTQSSSSSTVPRLVVESRLNFGAASTLRTFVSLDGEVGPSGAGSEAPPSATRLPIWTLGVALGATVGTR